MRRSPNSEQFRTWNGAEGHHWAEHQARYDAMARGYDEHLFEAAVIEPNARVLDIGCGTGQTTRAAARRAWRGEVVGIDLSAPMLARARQIADSEQLANVGFEQGDAQIYPFTAGRFDTVISRAGVMFFADPVAAFTNIATAVTAGGRLAFTCHSEPGETVTAIFTAISEYLAVPDLTAQAPGVADFADPDQVRQVLTGAGFTAIAATAFETPTLLGQNCRDVTDFLFDAQLRQFTEGADKAAMSQAKDAVEAILRHHETDRSIEIPARGWLYTATRGNGWPVGPA